MSDSRYTDSGPSFEEQLERRRDEINRIIDAFIEVHSAKDHELRELIAQEEAAQARRDDYFNKLAGGVPAQPSEPDTTAAADVSEEAGAQTEPEAGETAAAAEPAPEPIVTIEPEISSEDEFRFKLMANGARAQFGPNGADQAYEMLVNEGVHPATAARIVNEVWRQAAKDSGPQAAANPQPTQVQPAANATNASGAGLLTSLQKVYDRTGRTARKPNWLAILVGIVVGFAATLITAAIISGLDEDHVLSGWDWLSLPIGVIFGTGVYKIFGPKPDGSHTTAHEHVAG